MQTLELGYHFKNITSLRVIEVLSCVIGLSVEQVKSSNQNIETSRPSLVINYPILYRLYFRSVPVTEYRQDIINVVRLFLRSTKSRVMSIIVGPDRPLLLAIGCYLP